MEGFHPSSMLKYMIHVDEGLNEKTHYLYFFFDYICKKKVDTTFLY